MKIVILFKNRSEVSVECDRFTIDRNEFNEITSICFDEIKDKKMLHMNIGEILCIYRDMEAENDE